MVGPSRLAGALVMALGVAAAAACDRGPTLTNISSVEALQRQFDADAGRPRVVLLLSPT